MTTGTGSSSISQAMSANSPTINLGAQVAGVEVHDDAIPSGTGTTPQGLTDQQREAAIARAAASLEHHMELREVALLEYDITGDFGAKAEADKHRILAEEAMRLRAELIRGRSPEVVARLAIAQSEGSVA